MTTTAPHLSIAESRSVAYRLPERLRTSGLLLFTTDVVAAVLALVIVDFISGSGATAFLTLASAILIATGIGRYRTTFAATPADEWYASVGVGVLGMLVGMFFALILGFDLFAAPASALVWSLFAAVGAVHLQRMRRSNVRYEGALEYVRESRRGSLWVAQHWVIRLLDIMFAAIGMIVFSPLMLAVAILVLRDAGRPVFFSQTRVGRDDKSFVMWKFRTMRNGSGDEWARPGDERITRAGAFLRRTSLDELPQLWNVLRGDMSLVGPRPEMREYADRFAKALQSYSQRHIVRPGVTGWAQITLPRNFQPDDVASVLPYDLFYVQNAGLYLYMQCLVKTGCEILSHRAV